MQTRRPSSRRSRPLTDSAGAAAALATLRSTPAAELVAESTGEIPPPLVVPLGKTGLRRTRLAQGTGVHTPAPIDDALRLMHRYAATPLA